jgi:tRNA (guanine26-N2/guanine27-N2)-dimethyltransferase
MSSRNITTGKKNDDDELPDWVVRTGGGAGGDDDGKLHKSDKQQQKVASSTAPATTAAAAAATATTSTTATEAVLEGYEVITEGRITMSYPKRENSVFYNPVQVQNRDLSILMLGMYAERRKLRLLTSSKRKEMRKIMSLLQQEKQEKSTTTTTASTKESRKIQMAKFESELTSRVTEAMSNIDIISTLQSPNTTTDDDDDDDDDDDGLTILEALAASGLRSLRYWTEVPGIRSIVINDLDPVAIDMARTNVIRNNLLVDLVHDADDDEKKKDETTGLLRRRRRPRGIRLQVGDATHEMYMSRLSPRLRIDQFNITQQYQKPQYDIIDLDPYGSAAPYVDGAIQAVVHGGLLAITCTDMAALGGSHPETCYGRYGAFPIQRVGYLQELALRLLLYHVSIVAARYGRTIKPILSVGMAFYCRIFVEVYDDKAGVNNLSLCHGHLYQSSKCSSYHVLPVATNDYVQSCNNNNGDGGGDNDNNSSRTNSSSKKKKSNVYRNGRGPCSIGEPTCGETDGSYKIAGPLWIGPLHDMDVVTDAIHRLEVASQAEYGGVSPTGGTPMFPLHTATTIHGLLVSVSEELPDVPLYHLLPTLCSTVNSSTIPMTTFKAALVNAGYRVSAYHKEPSAVKTDAPNYVVWDVIRAWCKEHPPHTKKESRKHGLGEEQGGDDAHHASTTMTTNEEGGGGSVDIATRILSNESRTTIDFTIPEGLEYRKKARRWAQNPTANWGPKKAASGKNKRNNDTMMQEEQDDIINDDMVSEKKSKLK